MFVVVSKYKQIVWMMACFGRFEMLLLARPCSIYSPKRTSWSKHESTRDRAKVDKSHHRISLWEGDQDQDQDLKLWLPRHCSEKKKIRLQGDTSQHKPPSLLSQLPFLLSFFLSSYQSILKSPSDTQTSRKQSSFIQLNII